MLVVWGLTHRHNSLDLRHEFDGEILRLGRREVEKVPEGIVEEGHEVLLNRPAVDVEESVLGHKAALDILHFLTPIADLS